MFSCDVCCHVHGWCPCHMCNCCVCTCATCALCVFACAHICICLPANITVSAQQGKLLGHRWEERAGRGLS